MYTLNKLKWRKVDKKYDAWHQFEKISSFSGMNRVWNTIFIDKKDNSVQFSIYGDMLSAKDIVALADTIKELKGGE